MGCTPGGGWSHPDLKRGLPALQHELTSASHFGEQSWAAKQKLHRCAGPAPPHHSCSTIEADTLYIAGACCWNGLWHACTSLVSCGAGQLCLVHRTAAPTKTRACSEARGAQGSAMHT